MDPIALVVGGALLLAGYLAGRISRPSKPADATQCPGCQHSITFRDQQTGHCTQQIQRPNKYDGGGGPVAYEWVPCTCANHSTIDQLLITGTQWAPAPEIKE